MSDVTIEELIRRIDKLERSVAQLAARLSALRISRDAQPVEQQRWMIPPYLVLKKD